MNHVLNQTETSILAEAVAAVNAGTVAYADPALSGNLVNWYLVEINPNMVHPEKPNLIAHRATQIGIAFEGNLAAAAAHKLAEVPTTVKAPMQPASASEIQVGNSGFVPPRRAARSLKVGKGIYPFEQIPLGGYFFVPSTPERPDPKKSMASAISNANKRFEDFAPRRYFKAYRAVKGQVFGEVIAPSNGVYVVRVEPPVATPEDAPHA